MTTILILKGIPASGKSVFAKQEVAKDPLNTIRINNDDLRSSFNGSEWSSDYEKIIAATRSFLIKEAIKRDIKTIVIDNVNANDQFKEAVKLAREMNKDCFITEKPFYVDLETAIERDSKREGKAKVGPEVITKFWKKLGGKQFAHYIPKCETIIRTANANIEFIHAEQNVENPLAIISDLDGTCALFAGKRSPYDATNCDLIDDINLPVAETIKRYYWNDERHKIIFCSGREDKYEPETRRFIEKHFPKMEYQLFMRKTGDMRKDSIIKEEIYRNHIEGKYYVKLVLDDRLSVCRLWYGLGLNLFRVGDPDADFQINLSIIRYVGHYKSYCDGFWTEELKDLRINTNSQAYNDEENRAWKNAYKTLSKIMPDNFPPTVPIENIRRI